MTLQTTTKTDGATGLFTVTAARLPELIDEIGMGMFQIIQFLPVLFVPLCEGANILVPRPSDPEAVSRGQQVPPPPFSPFLISEVMTNVTHALKQNFQLSSWQAGSLDTRTQGLLLSHCHGFLPTETIRMLSPSWGLRSATTSRAFLQICAVDASPWFSLSLACAPLSF